MEYTAGTAAQTSALMPACRKGCRIAPATRFESIDDGVDLVEVRAGGALFGVSASLDAVAQASAGKIVVHPTGFLLGALGLTLYSDPRVYVTALGASSNGRTPPTYRLSAVAVLR